MLIIDHRFVAEGLKLLASLKLIPVRREIPTYWSHACRNRTTNRKTISIRILCPCVTHVPKYPPMRFGPDYGVTAMHVCLALAEQHLHATSFLLI
jgi:hypothetical protein